MIYELVDKYAYFSYKFRSALFVFTFDIVNVIVDDMRLWKDCQITFYEERMIINYFGCSFVYLAYICGMLSADVNSC